MPSRNKVKQYLPNSVYHVYNRGVEKRAIFLGSQDYRVFLNSVRDYTLPREEVAEDAVLRYKSMQRLNSRLQSLARIPTYAGNVRILCFALAPNHFHFLLKQVEVDGMTRFMRSLSTKYSMYFNRKNKRVGSLYQDVYKARRIGTNKDLLETSRYIHRNFFGTSGSPETNPWSSLQYYSHKKAPKWIHQSDVMDAFTKSPHCSKHKTYLDYIKDQP
jgi:REP element-mobilizing transposase RayT